MKHSILVVDDDPELREMIAIILSEAGFNVALAANGVEALEQVGRVDFSAVLLDLLMPMMGGMEVLPQLKRRRPRLKVIMMTAFATIENAVNAMRKGADDYLTKPFNSNELVICVRRVLEEAKIQACHETINVEGAFNCLANSIRRQILFELQKAGVMRFMDITRKLGIEDHTKVNFHLRILRDAGFIHQDSSKMYQLSQEGSLALDCIQTMVETMSH